MHMPVKIDSDHPTFLLKPKINEVCKNFLTQFGFNYFQYLRCYADGSIGFLTNNTGVFEYFQQMDNSRLVFSSFENENSAAHSYWFLWDEKLPTEPVRIAREKFNIRNGLTLVRRSKDYYDMIAVALPYEQENPGTFYLNKMKAIEQFINEFDIDNKDLLKIMSKNPIALPERYRDVNYQYMCLPNGKIEIAGKYGMTYITARELACLRLLCYGASHKTIAQSLEISSRTVETYINRVKHRTGFISSEIERKIICP